MWRDSTPYFTEMFLDNDFSFSISFHLRSAYSSATGIISTEILKIDNLLSVTHMDQDNFLFLLDLNSDAYGFTYTHSRTD